MTPTRPPPVGDPPGLRRCARLPPRRRRAGCLATSGTARASPPRGDPGRDLGVRGDPSRGDPARGDHHAAGRQRTSPRMAHGPAVIPRAPRRYAQDRLASYRPGDRPVRRFALGLRPGPVPAGLRPGDTRDPSRPVITPGGARTFPGHWHVSRPAPPRRVRPDRDRYRFPDSVSLSQLQ